jgi:hypothetical protein
VLFCAELPSDSFPSRAKRSDNEAAGWLSQADSESLRRPKRSHPYGLPEGAFPPDLPRWVRALHECALPDQRVNSRFPEIATFAFQPTLGRQRRERAHLSTPAAPTYCEEPGRSPRVTVFALAPPRVRCGARVARPGLGKPEGASRPTGEAWRSVLAPPRPTLAPPPDAH